MSHEFDIIGKQTILNFIVIIIRWPLLQFCYLRMMEHILLAVREGENNAQAAEAHSNGEIGSASSRLGSTPESLSSPASLAEVLRSTRRMITEQAGECILVCSIFSYFHLYMSWPPNSSIKDSPFIFQLSFLNYLSLSNLFTNVKGRNLLSSLHISTATGKTTGESSRCNWCTIAINRPI